MEEAPKKPLYKSLKAVQAAIAAGKLNPKKCYVQADAGDLTIYLKMENEDDDPPDVFVGHEKDAFLFVAAVLGMKYEDP
jgi:hypothetical protein